MSEQTPSKRVPRKPAAKAVEEAGAAEGFPSGIAAAAKPIESAPAERASAEPATAAATPEPTLTRRSRKAGGGNPFEIPEKLKKPGWDYEWKTVKVMGELVDDSDLADIHEQGWRPVPAEQMKELLAPGSTAKTIDRRGQRLFMRPMHLTEEARREDREIAETQKYDKLRAASAIPISRPGLMNAQVDTMQIEGEVGTHRPKAA